VCRSINNQLSIRSIDPDPSSDKSLDKDGQVFLHFEDKRPTVALSKFESATHRLAHIIHFIDVLIIIATVLLLGVSSNGKQGVIFCTGLEDPFGIKSLATIMCIIFTYPLVHCSYQMELIRRCVQN
jgi:hypothetical protein